MKRISWIVVVVISIVGLVVTTILFIRLNRPVNPVVSPQNDIDTGYSIANGDKQWKYVSNGKTINEIGSDEFAVSLCFITEEGREIIIDIKTIETMSAEEARNLVALIQICTTLPMMDFKLTQAIGQRLLPRIFLERDTPGTEG